MMYKRGFENMFNPVHVKSHTMKYCFHAQLYLIRYSKKKKVTKQDTI
jgi:hypothetical protein